MSSAEIFTYSAKLLKGLALENDVMNKKRSLWMKREVLDQILFPYSLVKVFTVRFFYSGRARYGVGRQ